MSKILIETSARHVHVTKETFEILFGEGKELTPKKDLSQPGQFACVERVNITGSKSTMNNISILGPFRKSNQVEISKTDARTLGVDAFIRESGDISGSAGCKIIGPAGEIDIKEGVIIAKRHIHLTPDQAKSFDVSDKEVVGVKVSTPDRSLIFGDVIVRVNEKFDAAMHIDTDESNSANISPNTFGEIIKL